MSHMITRILHFSVTGVDKFLPHQSLRHHCHSPLIHLVHCVQVLLFFTFLFCLSPLSLLHHKNSITPSLSPVLFKSCRVMHPHVKEFNQAESSIVSEPLTPLSRVSGKISFPHASAPSD